MLTAYMWLFFLDSSIFSKSKECKDPVEQSLTLNQYLFLPEELPGLLITSTSLQGLLSLMWYSTNDLIFSNTISFTSRIVTPLRFSFFHLVLLFFIQLIYWKFKIYRKTWNFQYMVTMSFAVIFIIWMGFIL